MLIAGRGSRSPAGEGVTKFSLQQRAAGKGP